LVFFVEAAHFVHGAFLGMVWCWVRLFLPTPSGRKRLNVLGALNAVTHEVLTVINETSINAESVCQLLAKVAEAAAGVPVTLVLDNARYQHCRRVQASAADLTIELLFLPPYSPQLNLIERFWKFVKKECLYSKYYSEFGAFKTAIIMCIDHANTVHKEALSSLLTWNFQSFNKVKFMT
jgi:transposase